MVNEDECTSAAVKKKLKVVNEIYYSQVRGRGSMMVGGLT